MPRIPFALPGAATLLAVAVTLLTLPSPARAQDDAFTLGMFGGTTGRGPAGAIDDSFAAAGFEGVAGDCRIRCEPIDRTETGAGVTGYPFLVELRWAGPTAGPAAVGVALQYGASPIGRTRGARGRGSLERDVDFLYLEYGSTMAAAVASVHAWNVLRLGAGAARYAAEVSRQDSGRLTVSRTTTTWAPVLEGGLAVRLATGVRAALRGQYRMVGNVGYGPYDYSERDGTVILGAQEADFTHWMAGVGVEVGLGR